MGRVQYYCAATLDGYIASADDGLDWLLGYDGSTTVRPAEPGPFGEGNSYERFYGEIGALVSGSTTYEFVFEHFDPAEGWPYRDKPYWVLSSSEAAVPEAAGVDVRSARGDVRDLHEAMMESAAGANLWVVGGGNVASQFADAGLLDDLLLTVVPVVIGEGKPLFDRALPGGPPRLVGTTTYESGLVELRYELDRSATANSANRAAT